MTPCFHESKQERGGAWGRMEKDVCLGDVGLLVVLAEVLHTQQLNGLMT